MIQICSKNFKQTFTASLPCMEYLPIRYRLAPICLFTDTDTLIKISAIPKHTDTLIGFKTEGLVIKINIDEIFI